MNQLVPIAASGTLIAAAGECAQERFIESGFKSCLSAFGPPPAQADADVAVGRGFAYRQFRQSGDHPACHRPAARLGHQPRDVRGGALR